jgi:hypothetical protein
VTVAIPARTAGCQIRGAGLIKTANGDWARFLLDGNATSGRDNDASEDRTKEEREDGNGGVQRYADAGPATRFLFRSSTTAAVVCGNSSPGSIFGTGRVNGKASVVLRIDVTHSRASDDQDGRSNDTYRIRLSKGYDSGRQAVLRGRIKVTTSSH